MRRKLTSEAEQDLIDILEWSFERFGQAAYGRYRTLLSAALREIARNPNCPGSRARPEIAKNVRTYHLRCHHGGKVRNPRHFLLYRCLPGRIVEVGRILHESMDIETHLPETYRRGG